MSLLTNARRIGLAGLIAMVSGMMSHVLAHHDSTHEVAVAPKAMRSELGTSVAFSPAGVLHAVAKQGEHVMLYRSRDLGVTWEAPMVVNAVPEAISADGENRPKIAFARDGGVLVSWTRSRAKPYTGDVRLARSDDGTGFAEPITVHGDRSEITHRFESMLVTRDGRVVAAWIDKRDLEDETAAGRVYRGAAIYVATSDDHGRSFQPEVKVADHSCECCRIAIAEDVDGAPLLLWRHVFEPNERDHAMARLGHDGRAQSVVRATFDRWAVDACPHHGPSLSVASDGTRHAVWFNHRDNDGRVFYGRLVDGSVEGQRTVGGERAAHADIASNGARIAVVWKEFDGERTGLYAEISEDGGQRFATSFLAETGGASDQPRVIRHGNELFVFWRTANEGMKGYPL